MTCDTVLTHMDGAKLVAIGSRSKESATTFGKEFKYTITMHHTSYRPQTARNATQRNAVQCHNVHS